MSYMLHFPTATGWLIGALAEATATLPNAGLLKEIQRPVKVSSSVPTANTEFVRLWRAGGYMEGILDHAVFTVEFWSHREDYSEAGATYVRDLIYSWRGGKVAFTDPDGKVREVSVKQVENSGLALLPDPDRPELYRTTFTTTLDLRGTMTE